MLEYFVTRNVCDWLYIGGFSILYEYVYLQSLRICVVSDNIKSGWVVVKRHVCSCQLRIRDYCLRVRVFVYEWDFVKAVKVCLKVDLRFAMSQCFIFS